MSGELTSMSADELTIRLKNLASAESYADALEELHHAFRSTTADGLANHLQFAVNLIEHLHEVVPIFDRILTSNERDERNYRETNAFLRTVCESFEGLCLYEVFARVKEVCHVRTMFSNYVALLKPSYFSDNEDFDPLTTCLIPIVGLSSLIIAVKEDDLPSDLLAYLLTFTRTYWRSPERLKIVRCILGMMKALSKKPALVPLIIRTAWPHSCIEWLAMKVNGEPIERPAFHVDYHILLMLQKLARHNGAVSTLNELNCLQAFEICNEQLKKCHGEQDFACLHFLECMIYALLVQADEIKQMSMQTDEPMAAVLHQMVNYVLEASRTEYMMFKCFHISEILSVVSKLFVNDDILTCCLNENRAFFDCLCQLLVHFAAIHNDPKRRQQLNDDEMLLTLVNLLWSISFHQVYQEKFRSNSMLMHTLSNLVGSTLMVTGTQTKSIPRDLCSLKKAAEGILWNLKSPSAPVVSSNNEKNEKSPLAMISYSHSDSAFCRELVERLAGRVPVWVDYKQASDAIAHSDDLWEEIARAMETATVIILIVSKEYYDSKSCRQELSYATDTLRKRIIPVYAPYQQYRASGWLGIRIAGQKYIHFGRKLFHDGIEELASLVLNEQKPSTDKTPTLVPPPQLLVAKTSDCEEQKTSALDAWTKDDVHKWFRENHIHSDLVQIYADLFRTGTSLIVYARHLKYFYRNEYLRVCNKYAEAFKGKRLETLEFVTFVDALYRLRAEHDPNSQLEDKYDLKHSSIKWKGSDSEMTWL